MQKPLAQSIQNSSKGFLNFFQKTSFMQLIICEKPKVARKLANALSTGQVKQFKDFKVPYYLIERDGKQIYVVSAVGHIYSLSQISSKRTLPVFDIDWLPAYKVDKSADYTKDYIKTIEHVSKSAEQVISACDFDIEGSLIGFNAIRFACKRNNGLRMKFSTLTKEDLIKSYENLIDLDFENAYAGEVRHKLDWFYGINLSRALMNSIRKAGVYKTMSIGRVQGPALAILSKRELEIKAFVPKKYYELFIRVKNIDFQNEKLKFDKKDQAELALKNTTSPAKVIEVKKRKVLQKPPFPFDLTTLQIEAHKALKIDPKQTLEIAQRLYEDSVISYPRTSSQRLPSSLNLKKILSSLQNVNEYSDFIKIIFSKNKSLKPVQGKKDDPAHPAIHPTGVIKQLSGKELKIYDLIVRRFLSCLSSPAVRQSQKVRLKAGTENYFATGIYTEDEGWFSIYSKFMKLEDIHFPKFDKQEQLPIQKIDLLEKQTKPPKRYTEASLISELEKKNLGTKATRAGIIDTLFKRNYAKKQKSIHVTEFGLAVYETLKQNCDKIIDEKLTEKIEEDMEKIQQKQKQPEEVLEEGKQILITIIDEFKKNEDKIGKNLALNLRISENNQNILGKCPNCEDGRLIIIKSKTTNKRFVGCTNYPKCKTTFPIPGTGKIVPTNRVCKFCNTPIFQVKRKGKKSNYEMCLDPNCSSKKNWKKRK